MTSENNLPSAEPGSDNDLASLMGFVLRKFAMQSLDGMLPAKVISYDRAKNVATVQPLIQILSTSGKVVTRAPLSKVPVLALGGGGFVINFPLKKDDLGWIEASDRDITLFMATMKESRPNTVRYHRFSDARFVPDTFRQYTIAGEDADAMVVQTLDGSTKVALSPAGVRVKTADTVTIDGAVKVEIKSATTVTLAAPIVTITGATSIIGGGQPVSITGPVSIDGKAFLTHTHSIPTGQSGPVT